MRTKHRIALLAVAFTCVWIAAAAAETIRVTTYNIENFREHFEAQRLTTQQVHKQSEAADAMVKWIRAANEEDLWEIGTTIRDPKVNPDILVIQEGCNQEDLDKFNKRFLDGGYETVIVFPTNLVPERPQHLAMMLKPGFKVLERKDQYYLEKDTVAKERGDRLFARGPAFMKIQSPGGYVFWVGTNHMKSKSGNSPEATAWRNREAKRTHEIIKELEAAGPADVLFLGDLNDELGIDNEFEKEHGGDSIGHLIGPAEAKLSLVTKPLLARGDISYGGYWREDRRSFIDHAIATAGMSQRVKGVSVFEENLAPAASDHYPVTVVIESPAK